jgi:alcohol dehydrogenase class IV
LKLHFLAMDKAFGMNIFEFVSVPRIIFGNGSIRQAGRLAAGFGDRALIVAGGSEERLRPLLNSLHHHQIKASVLRVRGEPTVEDVQAGVHLAQENRCNVVIGFGGGSALDAGKAIAILFANEGEITDYLEVVGKGRELSKAGLPLITIPTTAGTGAEVTRNAVIGAPEFRVKVSLRGPELLARVAVIDPELTYSLPAEVTAWTGMDALSQLVEPFVSNQANWMTDIFCREGIARVRRSLLKAFRTGKNVRAREDMAFASMLSGLALANAKLGVVHGFASVIGGMFPIPHGMVCARLLPGVMRMNLRTLEERGGNGTAIRKYTEVARILTGDTDARPMDGVGWVARLVEELQIPALSAFGLKQEDATQIVEKAMVASSTKGNPIVLTPEEMLEILLGVI